MITLRYVTDPSKTGKAFHYKTVEGARKKATSLVGKTPKVDPEGYVFSRVTGNCLFVIGAELIDVFPSLKGSNR